MTLSRKEPKPRLCGAHKLNGCKNTYIKLRMDHEACSVPCALLVVEEKKTKKAAKAKKAFKRETRRMKQDLKTTSDVIKEIQPIFNQCVRLRDKNDPCISCQRHHTGQYHASHYRSVGACPELRFEPLNCHKSCSACNEHLSGNIVEYRIHLINKIGIERVEWLEGPHPAKKYTMDQVLELKKYYARLVKELEL